MNTTTKVSNTSRIRYNADQLEEIKSYVDAGFTYKEIAQIVGRTTRAIENLSIRKKWRSPHGYGPVAKSKQNSFPVSGAVVEQKDKKVEQKESVQVKEKTLKDFTPREMIKYLYDLGYRIKNNMLICLVEKVIIDEVVVKLEDIINGN